MAHATRHPHLRLPDWADQLRPALDLRLFPHADGRRERLGPRSVRAGARDRDAAVGRRTAVLRRARRPLRRGGVLAVGALLYIAGLVWMAYATTPFELYMSAGRVDRLGLPAARSPSSSAPSQSCCRRSWRTIAFGAGTAAGSFGQFLFSPLAVALIDNFGWQHGAVDLCRDHVVDAAAGFASSAAAERGCGGRRGRAGTDIRARHSPRRSGTEAMCC